MMDEQSDRNCPICLEATEDGGSTAVHMCSDKTHGDMCRECSISYISSKVSSAFLGTCPSILCPRNHKDQKEKRRILSYDDWKSLVPTDVSSKFALLADSLLAFLCGGCHVLKSIQINSTEEQIAAAEEYIRKHITQKRDEAPPSASADHAYSSFNRDLRMYTCGELSAEDFYTTLQSQYFARILPVGSDKEAWDCFQNVLRLIRDPERRANLHLRHLRSRPRMWTPCCNREHCFRCRTKDFHEGKTCDENTASLDQSVITCPACCVAIAKGDGCNTVTCVCGKQFSWSTEKEHVQRCSEFLQKYPTNTSIACADVLFSEGTTEETLQLARAWQHRNAVTVNRELMNVWLRKYSQCSSQACAVLPIETMPLGYREASSLWRTRYGAEVAKCVKDNATSIHSIFLTMFPSEEERPVAAMRVLGAANYGSSASKISESRTVFARDPRLLTSARMWRDEHRALYDNEMENWERRRAAQFLQLYGNKVPAFTNPSAISYPFPSEWSVSTSNPSLTYSHGNTSAERAGSVSCYPAAFADLPSERSMFTVLIDSCPRGTNWLTFGLARRGMANSSSDGVGRTTGSWGLCDDRSTADVGAARVCASGTDVATCRKFQQGDKLTAVVYTSEGWLEVYLNDEEFNHRFEIPTASASEYMFATTFANDHRVTILPEGRELPGSSGQLNVDHSEMLSCLKRRMRKILGGEKSVSADSVDALSEKWESSCGGNEQIAHAKFLEVQPLVDRLLGRKTNCASSKAVAASLPPSPPPASPVAVAAMNHGRRGLSLSGSKDSMDDLKPAATSATTGTGSGTAGSDLEILTDIAKNYTWQHLVYAVSWYRKTKERLELAELCDQAQIFSAMHGESAPFIAAALWADPQHAQQQQSSATTTDEARMALAFMRIFPGEMNEWYDYNFGLQEPMLGLERADCGCRCLPRHIRKCPNPTIEAHRISAQLKAMRASSDLGH